MLKITWLEELASESNTIQAQEVITQQGKIAGQDTRKLYVLLGRFFINISGSLCSFGLAFCVVRDIILVHVSVAARCSRKSVRERFRWDKVPCMMMILTNFTIWGR